MAYLILVRHGLSEYNKRGLWTGWIDPDLAPEGVEEARKAGESLKDIHFDVAYVAVFRRARQTLEQIKQVTEQTDFQTIVAWQVNERNYGEYTLKNKWDVEKEIGQEAFQKLRRSWDYPIPSGESLKQVYEREIPYYSQEIEPKLKAGKNILIASSGNALRALAKYIEDIPYDEIGSLEIGTGEVLVYTIDANGKMTHKEIRTSNENAGKV